MLHRDRHTIEFLRASGKKIIKYILPSAKFQMIILNKLYITESRLLKNKCSGGSRGGPPLFLDQSEAQRAEKMFLGKRPPLSPPGAAPLFKGLDDRGPPLSQGLDPALKCIVINLQKFEQDECFDSAAPKFSTEGNISDTRYCPY